MTALAQPEPAATPRRDAWDNVITSAYGLFGQYTARSVWDGRTLYVCGDIHKKHGQRTHWRQWKRDGRRERGQVWICPVCFTIQAGLYE